MGRVRDTGTRGNGDTGKWRDGEMGRVRDTGRWGHGDTGTQSHGDIANRILKYLKSLKSLPCGSCLVVERIRHRGAMSTLVAKKGIIECNTANRFHYGLNVC